MSIDMMSTCAAGGPALATFTAAVHFFAASQCLLKEPWPESAHVQNGSRFDFIVVGAGTAGSTVAARLAKVKQFNVLLIEAGGYPPQDAIIPGFRDVLKHSPYDWNFTTVNDGFSSQGLRDGKQMQPRGKMLGGTGSMSDMVYSRGHPEDYYEWAAIAGDFWNWTNVLEYFKKTEYVADETILINSELLELHGQSGEIQVAGLTEQNDATNKLLEAFKELNIEIVDDMTNPSKIGAGRLPHNVKNGRRVSTLTALLDTIHADNLYVLNDTYVTKILIENNAAVGVRAISNGQEIELYANKEVILSAGTINTPKLLMLSGVGPEEHLNELEINVIKDLPVGDNLRDHIMVINYLVIEKGTCTYETSRDFFEMIRYFYNFSGKFSYSDSMGVYLPKTGGKPNVPHFAIFPVCMPVNIITLIECKKFLGYDETVCEKIINVNKDFELIPLPVVLLKPQSKGKLRLNTTNPTYDPLIYSGAFSNEADFEGFADAIRFALSLANTTYFKSQGARVLDYASERCSEHEEGEDRIQCQMKDYAMPAWHTVGTAAMGSVVDSELRVLGLERLRVVDASVIPVAIRGNINAPVVMLAEKAADLIKHTHNAS